MKRSTKLTRLVWLLLLVLVIALAGPATGLAAQPREDKIVFGGTYTLNSGESLEGSLVVLAGVALLQPGSQVTGDVVVVGGTLRSSGEVSGSLIGVGGLLTLEEGALVAGDVVILGAQLDREPGVRILGEVVNTFNGPLSFDFPGQVSPGRVNIGLDPVFSFTWFVFRAFLWAALAVLVLLFAPRYTERVSAAALSQPVAAWALGLLTVVVAPVVVVILVVTIILIPAAALAIFALAALWAFGLVALGLEVGRRLARTLKQDWAPVAQASVGTLVLVVLLNGIQAVVPCVGWLFPAMVGMLGLGAVLLTRLGTQAYPPAPANAPALPTAPPPAAPTRQVEPLSPPPAPDLGAAPSGQDELPPALRVDLDEPPLDEN
jgi:hypothetical protein